MRALIARRPARGFSMVELMVAMVISLIGVIIIFQVFETSEGVRRTATSGGDAQQNGAVALYFMERDLRNAGMGVSDTIYAGCNMIGSDSSRTTPNFPPLGNPMILAPAFITAGVDAKTPDQLTVFYGSQNQIANSTTLVANMVLPTSPLAVQTRFAFRPGDLKFDPTVRQISDPAHDIKTLGDLPNRPSKTDTLDIAFVKDLKRDHANSRSS